MAVSHAEPVELSLPCESCDVLVAVWLDVDDWLDGTVRVRCVQHRTSTSAP